MFKHLSLLLAASSIAAADIKYQNLTDLLSSIPELSQYYGAVTRDPTVLTDFALAANVTVFATSNAAFLPTVGPESGFLSVADSVHAGLQYSIVDGILHSANFTTVGTFLHSHLTNLSWTTVSGGQVLEVVEVIADGSAETSSVGTSGETQSLVYAADRASVNITTPDIQFYDASGNIQGIVHIVDGHLYPPGNMTTTADSLQIASVGTASQKGQVSPNEVIPDITIFACNNASYNTFLNSLPSYSPAQQEDLTLYNAINGTIAYSTSFTPDGSAFPTREGDSVTLKLGDDGTLYVNDAIVLIKDILLENGVMHVIDRPLYPSAAPAPSNGTRKW